MLAHQTSSPFASATARGRRRVAGRRPAVGPGPQPVTGGASAPARWPGAGGRGAACGASVRQANRGPPRSRERCASTAPSSGCRARRAPARWPGPAATWPCGPSASAGDLRSGSAHGSAPSSSSAHPAGSHASQPTYRAARARPRSRRAAAATAAGEPGCRAGGGATTIGSTIGGRPVRSAIAGTSALQALDHVVHRAHVAAADRDHRVRRGRESASRASRCGSGPGRRTPARSAPRSADGEHRPRHRGALLGGHEPRHHPHRARSARASPIRHRSSGRHRSADGGARRRARRLAAAGARRPAPSGSPAAGASPSGRNRSARSPP